MSDNRLLALACAVMAAAWVGGGLFLSGREGNCNPDDTTGCDTLGWLLLYGLMFLLPAIFLVFGGVLAFRLLDGWWQARRNKKR